MKKLLKLLFVAFMVFTVSGCSSKSASDYYNLLEENDYKFLVSYDVSHFYDKYLECYDRSGNEIKPDRIKEKPDKSKECLLVDKNNKPKIEVFYDIKTDKTPLLFFYTDDGYYIADFKEKNKLVNVWEIEGTNVDSCEVVYEGKTDNKKCSSKQIKVADNIKKEYEDFLDKLEIKEEDLVDTFTWFNKEKTPEIKEKLIDEYNDQ
ncbi:MAG: lipoprotein [Thomasclavelia sp.]|uniref:LptM family lipoprotein n=1 Tax=Thomasclavelia sp. TaxID=3025757 RepID=UPI0039A30DEF